MNKDERKSRFLEFIKEEQSFLNSECYEWRKALNETTNFLFELNANVYTTPPFSEFSIHDAALLCPGFAHGYVLRSLTNANQNLKNEMNPQPTATPI